VSLALSFKTLLSFQLEKHEKVRHDVTSDVSVVQHLRVDVTLLTYWKVENAREVCFGRFSAMESEDVMTLLTSFQFLMK
jgi:hypothetical protein